VLAHVGEDALEVGGVRRAAQRGRRGVETFGGGLGSERARGEERVLDQREPAGI